MPHDDLLFRRGQPRFVVFDVLHCGRDLTYSPLVERKQRLRAILPKNGQSVLFCDHVETAGEIVRTRLQERSRRHLREARANLAHAAVMAAQEYRNVIERGRASRSLVPSLHLA